MTAVGNAGGKGGAPTVSTGKVVALGQSITALTESGGGPERLAGMIETSTPLSRVTRAGRSSTRRAR